MRKFPAASLSRKEAPSAGALSMRWRPKGACQYWMMRGAEKTFMEENFVKMWCLSGVPSGVSLAYGLTWCYV